MKKNVWIVMLLALCLLLSACGGEKDVAGSVETLDSTAAAPTGTVAPPETTVPETTVPETTAPAEENNLSLGRMEGGVYTNEYVGYTCTLDSNWTFLSAEELQQIPANVTDAISGSELAKKLEGVQQFTDMMAENVNDLTTVNVLYQKLSLQERIAYAALTEEQIVDVTLEQAAMLEEAYAQAGMTLLSMEKVSVEFMGETHFAIRSELTFQDVPYYVLQLFDFHLGEYAVTTTLASYVEDNTDSLLGLFYPLEK